MHGIFWILAGGIVGWLTGKILGREGYARTFYGYGAKGLDIMFGIVGASIGGYLFFWAVVGKGGLFSSFGTAVLGSIAVVIAARVVSAEYLRAASIWGRGEEGHSS